MERVCRHGLQETTGKATPFSLRFKEADLVSEIAGLGGQVPACLCSLGSRIPDPDSFFRIQVPACFFETLSTPRPQPPPLKEQEIPLVVPVLRLPAPTGLIVEVYQSHPVLGLGRLRLQPLVLLEVRVSGLQQGSISSLTISVCRLSTQ